MVSFRDYEIYLLFLLLVKFHRSGKCERYSAVQRILQCLFTICLFKPRHRKRRRFISDERNVRQTDFRTRRWLSTVFVFQNVDMMKEFQLRDKWNLNNYDAIEIKSKGFYASSLTIPYIQNETSKLKLRSVVFPWLVCVVFKPWEKLRLCQVAFHDNHANPENSCDLSINSLPCHPLLIIRKSC